MNTVYRAMPVFILIWTLWCWQTLAPAQESAPPVVVQQQPSPAQPVPLFDPGVLDFVKVFGLGGMVFIIWLFDYRRQTSMEEIIKKYDEAQKDHLAAFKDINERNITVFRESMAGLQKVAEDAKDNAVMCASVNTRVATALEYARREKTA